MYIWRTAGGQCVPRPHLLGSGTEMGMGNTLLGCSYSIQRRFAVCGLLPSLFIVRPLALPLPPARHGPALHPLSPSLSRSSRGSPSPLLSPFFLSPSRCSCRRFLCCRRCLLLAVHPQGPSSLRFSFPLLSILRFLSLAPRAPRILGAFALLTVQSVCQCPAAAESGQVEKIGRRSGPEQPCGSLASG